MAPGRDASSITNSATRSATGFNLSSINSLLAILSGEIKMTAASPLFISCT